MSTRFRPRGSIKKPNISEHQEDITYSHLRSCTITKVFTLFSKVSNKNRWVGDEDWTYTGQFQLSTSQLVASKIELDCEGLDTVAEVSINGIHVGSASNMFVRWEVLWKCDRLKMKQLRQIWDVKAALLEGKPTQDPQITEHTLVVQFQSAVSYSRNMFEKQVAKH